MIVIDMTHSGLTDYVSRTSLHQTMIYFVILFMVIVISFLGILSISSVHAKGLQPSQSRSQSPPPSVLKITNQKQFNGWQKESDQAEALGDYAAETNATDKMALTDCVNELVLSRNGTLDFAALYSMLINTNSTAIFLLVDLTYVIPCFLAGMKSQMPL
jgi:ABC-type transport system involved in multi-copper enzyme maturation permease subunit